jgi:hypothetical protein
MPVVRQVCDLFRLAPITKGQPLRVAPESSCAMDVFVVSEPLYDVCESWAEEPEPVAWDVVYPDALAWLIRLN